MKRKETEEAPKPYEIYLQNNPAPRCFQSKVQFRDWVELAFETRLQPSNFCADCTPEYQKQMVAEGRCEYPGTTFRLGKDGFIEGRRG